MNKLKLVISNGIDTYYESWNLRFTGKSDLTKENRENFYSKTKIKELMRA
jgi:hypothetical protein